MVRPWISLFDAEKKKQWQEEGGMLNSSSQSGYLFGPPYALVLNYGERRCLTQSTLMSYFNS